MAGGANVKVAAAELRKAAQARQNEIQDLRRTIASKESERRDVINDLRSQERLRQTQAAQADNDNERNAKARDAVRMRSQESEVDRDTNQAKSNISQQITMLEQDMNDLIQMAKDLENRAAGM